MAFQILKQFVARQDDEPIWAQKSVYVKILPDGGDVSNDKEDIYDTYEKADKDVKDKEDKDKEKKPDGKDKKDKFGKTIKGRKYVIIEI